MIDCRCIKDNVVLIKRAFTADFIIPEFTKFTDIIDEVYEMCKENEGGHVSYTESG